MDVGKLHGTRGIGVISDYEDQPLLIHSHLGNFAIVTVGVLKNRDKIVDSVFKARQVHFSEMRDGEINPTEVVAALISQGESFAEGVRIAGEAIDGSCSILLLTDKGVIAARDRRGRTPVIIGKKPGALAAALETCAFPNLDCEIVRDLGPGEIVRLSADGVEPLAPADGQSQICGFLWVYYGYPASSYEGINVESVRNRCGAMLRGTTPSRSISSQESPTRARATAWAMPPKPASPTAGPSSSTRRPGPAVSCPRTRRCGTSSPE